jgi:ribosome recycling factor
MYEKIIKEINPKMEKVIDFVVKKLNSFRAGRASPSLVDGIQVDCFGQAMKIQQLGAISLPSARQISIQPWDSSYLSLIEKAIIKEVPGLSPVVVGDSIIINMPQMSEELRKEINKSVSQVNDDAKKTIRKNRDEAWSEIQEKTREGLISEDDKFKGKDKLQEVVDGYNKKVDDLISRKKAEIEG